MLPHVPPSLHEAEVERHYARDPRTLEQVPDDDLRALAGAMASARRFAEQLAGLAEAMLSDRTRTPEAAAVELRRAALAVAEKGARALDTARSRAAEVLSRCEAETSAPPPPRDAVALQIESEVRSRLATMPPADRRMILSAAINAGDDAIVGAVLRGPALLTGMDPEEHDHLRLSWRQARHPETAARMDRLTRALEATDRGGDLLLRFVEQLSADPVARAANAQASVTDAALEAVHAAE